MRDSPLGLDLPHAESYRRLELYCYPTNFRIALYGLVGVLRLLIVVLTSHLQHLLKRRNHDCVLPATHGKSHTVDTFTGREFCPNCALWGNDKLLAADSDPQATTSMKNLVWTNQAAKRMLVCFTGLNSGCVIMPIKDNGNNFIGKTLSFVSAPRVAPRALHTRPRLEYVFFPRAWVTVGGFECVYVCDGVCDGVCVCVPVPVSVSVSVCLSVCVCL